MTGYEVATSATGAASVGGGILGSILGYKAQQNTNRTNLQLAQMQNDWNLEQWNRENAYNSPANQVKLLRDAGINPNTYEQGSATAPNLASADMANQQAPQIDLNTPLQSGLTALQNAAQAEELRAAIAESKQRQRIADSLLPYQIQAADLNNGFMADQRTIAYWQGQLARQQYSNERLDAPYRRANLSASTQNIYQGMQATAAGIKATEQGIEASKASVQQAWKDLEIKAHLSQWQIKQMQSDIASINENTNLLRFRVDMARKYHIDPNLPALNNLITFALSNPDQFHSAFNTIRTNVGGLFREAYTSGDMIGDALRRQFGFSWRNPGYPYGHAGSW